MNIIKDFIPLDSSFPFSVKIEEAKKGYNMGKTYHYHDCLEISQILEGSGTYHFENREVCLEAGDIAIINNIEPHYLEVTDDAVHRLFVFEPILVSDIKGGKDYIDVFFQNGSNFVNGIHKEDDHYDNIQHYLNLITQEYLEKPAYYRLGVCAYLKVLMTLLLRYYVVELEPKSRNTILKSKEITKYIEEHFKETIFLDDAANKLHLSKDYINRILKKATGYTFKQYLQQQRIAAARNLILSTNKTLLDIAVEVGFDSYGSFIYTYKKVIGQNPSKK